MKEQLLESVNQIDECKKMGLYVDDATEPYMIKDLVKTLKKISPTAIYSKNPFISSSFASL